MSYYIIGIGGSGAKCVEALVHTLAAVPLDQSVSILLVDPDTANGSLGRTLQALDNYIEAQESVGGEVLLHTLIQPTEPRVWTPFVDEARPVFRDLFQYELLARKAPVAAGLMDVLYSEQEKIASLDKGFLGHPSIGAAVLANAADLLTEKPWKEFCSDMRNDPDARLMLVGSIFGGTGASGLPTLARLLSDAFADRRQQFRLGATLLLPYFSFPPGEDPKQLQARSEEFVLRSQAALSYYQSQIDASREANAQGIYDAIYVLGSNVPTPLKVNSLGSTNQRNPAHYVELYAATAALDFFVQSKTTQTRTYRSARKNTGLLDWESLPGGFARRDQLANMGRFAYAYLSYFYPRLKENLRAPGSLGNITWFVKFFTKGQATNYARPLEQLADYCVRFLTWLDAIHTTNDALTVRYFDTNTFTLNNQGGIEFPPNASAGFQNFYVVNVKGVSRTLEEISNGMDRLNPKDLDGKADFGRFVNSLFKECRIR